MESHTGELIADLQGRSKFRFRGAGLSSIVIGFQNTEGVNIVWRFRAIENDSQVPIAVANFNYFNNVIRPCFNSHVLKSLNVCSLKFLTPNLLKTICSENDEIKSKLGDFICNSTRAIPVIEMLDFTNENFFVTRYLKIEQCVDFFSVELKPKQGHVTCLESFKPYCTNCLLQNGKSTYNRVFEKMYDYCPLKLFSGKSKEMKIALKELIRIPHNNFRLFKNGELVFSQKSFLDEAELCEALNFSNVDHFLNLLIRILLNSKFTLDYSGSAMNDGCVLGQLLKLQKLDTCGPIRAAELAKMYPCATDINLANFCYRIFDCENNKLSDDELLLKKCLIAATVKDCSIMISFCKLDNDCDKSDLAENVEMMQTGFGCFAFKVNLIDFDVKTPQSLLKYKSKLELARKRIDESCRKPCF